MAIVSGILSGIRSSIRSGINPSLSGSSSLAGVAQDATSLKYAPATAGQWSTTATAAGVSSPSLVWLCQDAAGALAAAVGSVTLASEGSRQAYQQTVAGWTRKGLQSTGDGWLSADASLPDISTTSQTVLLYAKQAVAGGTDLGLIWLGTTYAVALINTAKHIVARSNGVSGSAGVADVTGSVRPYVLQVNRTSSTVTLFTDQEKVTVAVGGAAGKGIYFTGGLLGDDSTTLYAAQWSGASAEMSNAQIKTLLTTLGWSVAWS